MTFDRYGLLPPVIRENYAAEQMVDSHLEAAHAVAVALHALDPRLELTFFGDRAEARGGIVPGRWHVVRKNEGPVPDTYIPITTPDGGYRYPDSGVIPEMERRDLWKHKDPVPERTPEASEPDLIEEMAHTYKAAKRVAGEGGMDRRKWGKGGKKK